MNITMKLRAEFDEDMGKVVAKLREIVKGKPKRVMRFFGGKYDRKEVDTWAFVEEGGKWRFEDYPFVSDDCTETRKRGGMCHREELDLMPMVDGYVGPMWNGDGLRYETQEVYNALSM